MRLKHIRIEQFSLRSQTNHSSLIPGEVRLCELPPDPLLPGDGVHGDAGVARPLNVLRVRQPQQDLAHALLRQRVDQSCSGFMFQFWRI